VLVTPLDRLEKPVWHVLSADFDQDGDTDVFVHGHRQSEGDIVYFRDGETFRRSAAMLGRGKDRHACAAADVNGDTLPDLYCTTGVEKGAGVNPNELWINQDGASFARAPLPFGAEEPASRGRLAAFLNFDGDDQPDLVTTVWGERSDDLPNRSGLFINEGGQFTALQTAFGERRGGRCLAVYDINADGFDDVFACAEGPGAQFFLNQNGEDFAPYGALDEATWWWGAAIDRADADPLPILALVGHQSKQSFIQVKALGPDEQRVIQRIDCSFDQPAVDGIFCGSVLLSDIDADGHIDIYLSRRMGWMLDPPTGDVEDLILLGPSFDRYLPVPPTTYGAGWQAAAIEDGVIRLNAGEKWGGTVEWVRAVRPSQENPPK
jgi:hypothetical protein